ncbi:MAG: hypothetical protein ACMZI0_07905 [Symbiopectobacterium sp.]|uniref:hypothetical protein n=1 Tax=Symbiopectobacterium sp. TaxID=2952789 RepID=UPI0039E929D6
MAKAGGVTKTNQYILQDFVFNGLPLGKMEFSDNQEGKFHVGMDFLSRFKRYTFIPSRMMFCYDTDSIKKITFRMNDPLPYVTWMETLKFFTTITKKYRSMD